MRRVQLGTQEGTVVYLNVSSASNFHQKSAVMYPVMHPFCLCQAAAIPSTLPFCSVLPVQATNTVSAIICSAQ